MKTNQNIRRLIYLCVLLLIAILGYSLYRPKHIDTYEKRFTFISPLQWNNIAAGIKAADKDFHTNTKLVGTDSLDLQKQVTAIKEAILSKPDGIITAASEDSEQLREVLHLAASEGIPVVLVDSDLPDSDRICYIGTDNLTAGRMAGEDMFHAIDGKAYIGVIVSDLESPNQKERLEGFQEQIRQYEDMEILEILECHSDRLELMEKIPKMLEQYPQMNALYLTEAFASVMAGTIIQDVPFSSRELIVVAFDNLNETQNFLDDGTYDSLICQSPYAQGYLAVEALCRILDGENQDEIVYTETLSMKQGDSIKQTDHKSEEFEWHLY
ncbi:MAG: substrate-binding domain-containing protein [Lachnospiraceae bacterium]|nr:substrate-binding domain-containing protein [Robinsoniella sp.]MDY3767415.1 substrate-binding domain-containing protein [Lachnospiraceae bacterium]